MTADFDDRANDEADRHAQMMQKQRKPKQVGTIGVSTSKKLPAIYCSVIPLLWHKTGTDYEK